MVWENIYTWKNTSVKSSCADQYDKSEPVSAEKV